MRRSMENDRGRSNLFPSFRAEESPVGLRTASLQAARFVSTGIRGSCQCVLFRSLSPGRTCTGDLTPVGPEPMNPCRTVFLLAAFLSAFACLHAADEPFRPRFHFTPQRNWMNDPNGLVYYAGEY